MGENNGRKRVMFVLPNLYAGGAERFIINILNNLDREINEPILVVLSYEGNIENWLDRDIRVFRLRARSVKGSALSLMKTIKNLSPDTIVSTMVHCNALVLLAKIFFPKTRVVVREAALPQAILHNYGGKERLSHWVYKLLYPLADMILTNCEEMRQQLSDLIPGVSEKMRVLFNPVSEDGLRSQLPSQAGPRFTGRRFVCVGRLAPEKGYDRLIQTLSAWKDRHDWQLDIIGEGESRESLSELVTKHDLQKHVRFLGYIDKPWTTAANADCLLLPSRWEGMPNVVLEALACGVPSIVHRDAGGVFDIVKETAKGDVTICSTMSEFLTAMEAVIPVDKSTFRPSRLPYAFTMEAVISRFQSLI